MSRLLQRMKTWTICRTLDIWCVIAGHNYGQHFTTLSADMTPEDGWEIPWCARCGRDAVR